MSATNSTTTLGLTQYISTDKPTYLVDHNDDMLKIDNAITSDREGIQSARNKANTADGKADANKTSIDTLNEQINGDPSAEPPTTGIAGDVSGLKSSVNTINSLLGDGSAIPTGQTVISGITNLEDSIAPVENGANVGANYEIGDQFNRGGVLYEALVRIASGTAFSTLVVNTDYKAADRLTKQIEDLSAEISGLTIGYTVSAFDVIAATVTADGVKTYAELLSDLETAYAAYVSGLSNKVARIEFIDVQSVGKFIAQAGQGATLSGTFGCLGTNGARDLNYTIQHISTGWRMSSCEIANDSTVTHTNLSHTVVDSNRTLKVVVTVYNVP